MVVAFEVAGDFSAKEAAGNGVIRIALDAGGAPVFDLDEEGAGIGTIERADGVTRSDHTFMVTARGGGAYPG